MDHKPPFLQPVESPPGALPPVTEADLHACADELLPATRQAEIEAYLANRPDDRARVEAWRAQNAALRGLLDPVLDEPLPLRLPVSPPTWRVFGRSIAAGVVIALASGGSAWWARGLVQGPSQTLAQGAGSYGNYDLPGFAQRAAVAHVVYTPEVRRPVEVGADQEQALVTWLTKRLGAKVQPPDLSSLGYRLVGGRLLPGGSGPVAQFMFETDDEGPGGKRLTLYVSREDKGRETAFRFGEDGKVHLFYWVDADFGYALASQGDRATLTRVADLVYKQLEARKPG